MTTGPLQDLPIGERIAIYRRRRGLSQAVAAGLVGGRTEAWLSQIERGIRPIDRLSVLTELAGVLRVDVLDLLGRPLRVAPDLVGEHPIVPALRAVLMGDDASFGGLLPDVQAGHQEPPLATAQLESGLREVWSTYYAARYSALTALLPQLVADAAHGSRAADRGDDRRAAASVLAQACHVAIGVLAKVGEVDLAWLVADRSLTAARELGEPALLAACGYNLAHVFMQAGQLPRARAVVDGALGVLEQGLAGATDTHLSMWGALQLSASVAAARSADRAAVQQHLTEAAATSSRLSPTGADHPWTAFSATNVAFYRVSVAVELGDGGDAVAQAAGVDLGAMASLERRSRFLVDVARGHAQRRDDVAAVRTLLTAETMAPEDIHASALVRALTVDLLARERRTVKPELRGLASRVGVLA